MHVTAGLYAATHHALQACCLDAVLGHPLQRPGLTDKRESRTDHSKKDSSTFVALGNGRKTCMSNAQTVSNTNGDDEENMKCIEPGSMFECARIATP